MIYQILNITFQLSSLVINIITIMLCLPRKRSLPVTISAFAILSFIVMIIDQRTGISQKALFPIGYAFMIIMPFLFKGHLFKVFFAMFMQLFISVAIILLASMIFGFFVPYGSNEIFILMFIATFVLYSLYIFLINKYGRKFLNMIFESGNKRQWALYMTNMMVTHLLLFILRRLHSGQGGNVIHFIALLFLIWSFIILCYAIINTNEKTKQKHEADFAKEIIASGEAHYKKMNDLLTSLRIMRHDSKYHQRVLMDFLQKGETAKAIEYLGGIQDELSKHELDSFCGNQVVNALLTWYAERCKALNINYTFKAAIPDNLSVADYDLCIVIGNLLENALAASQTLTNDRKITLNIMLHNDQLVIKAENNFDKKKSEVPKDQTEGRGLGLRSIRLITERYGGQFIVKTDSNVFTASVLMNL